MDMLAPRITDFPVTVRDQRRFLTWVLRPGRRKVPVDHRGYGADERHVDRLGGVRLLEVLSDGSKLSRVVS